MLAADVDGRRGLIGATVSLQKAVAGHSAKSLRTLERFGSIKLARIDRFDASWVHGRDTSRSVSTLINKTVAILGCGSLGSHVAIRLAQSGVGSLTLIDPENLEAENVGRHALGIGATGSSKAKSLAMLIKRRFPHLNKIEGNMTAWPDPSLLPALFEADLIVSAIGEMGPEFRLDDQHRSNAASPPIIYAWMEPYASAAHSVAILDNRNCLRCILNPDGTPRETETSWATNSVLKAEPACGNYFQSYGAVDLGAAELLTSDLALRLLSGELTQNVHMVSAVEKRKLEQLGGSWTASHEHYRPENWRGAITFERPIQACERCQVREEEALRAE